MVADAIPIVLGREKLRPRAEEGPPPKVKSWDLGITEAISILLQKEKLRPGGERRR